MTKGLLIILRADHCESRKLLFGSETVLGGPPRRSAAAAFQRCTEKRGLQGDLRLYLRLFLRLFGRQFGLK
jgi:hypothetical protein